MATKKKTEEKEKKKVAAVVVGALGSKDTIKARMLQRAIKRFS